MVGTDTALGRKRCFSRGSFPAPRRQGDQGQEVSTPRQGWWKGLALAPMPCQPSPLPDTAIQREKLISLPLARVTWWLAPSQCMGETAQAEGTGRVGGKAAELSQGKPLWGPGWLLNAHSDMLSTFRHVHCLQVLFLLKFQRQYIHHSLVCLI